MKDGGNAPIRNSISFDLEHWYSATLVADTVENPVDRIEKSTDIVLDMLRSHDVKATFFVLGTVADEHRNLVQRVADEGHEVASHGYSHTPLFDLSPDEFESELVRSATAIERAVGSSPEGFRAPNFSVTRQTEWAFDVLESEGYRYDSSVFPTRTPMYGVSGAPLRPYRVSRSDPFRESATSEDEDGLIEYPLAVTDTPLRIPIAGGFYLRVGPTRLFEWGIRHLNRRGIPANLYFHPWEFNSDVRVDSLSPHKRFVSFRGIETLKQKVERLLTRFDFGTVSDSLEADASFESPGRSNEYQSQTQ